MAEDGRIEIDKFDGHDFGFWKMQIENYALGAVRLSLAKNVAYNIVNEKTTYDLFKALSNMYEKSSASNNVFLIQELVNTKMKEGASVVDHSWLGTVTAVSGSTESTKLKFDNIRDLIIEEDIRRKTSEEYSNSLLTSKDKEVHMAVRDYDDALVCCVENMVEDRIIDSGALFHATFCKEELEKFSLHSSKVRLVDEKTLDIAGVGDVASEISSRRRNAALWHQRLEHMSEKGMKILASKCRIPDLQKAVVDPTTMLPLSLTAAGSSQEFVEYYAENGIRMLKTVLETHQQNGVAERMNRTLNERAKSMRLHVGLPKMFLEDSEVSLAHLRVFGCDSYVMVKDVERDKLDANSVKCTFIGYDSDEMGYRFRDSKGHKVIRSRDVTYSLYGVKASTDSGRSSDTSDRSKNSGSFKDSGRSDEEDSEDRASSEKGGSKNPQVQRSIRESRALVSKESVHGKKAINEEMVSLEKNKTWSLVRLPAAKKALQSKWVFRVKEEQDDRKRLVLSIIASEDLHLEQLNVKTTFLHGDIDEDIYMTQPEGFLSAGKEENLV
ncbi:retrovirus-related pol polyprotein from transposon TNT 1-94 [Tanacetum coccineum]